MKLVNLVGQRFGRLVVQRRGPQKTYGVTWRCVCDCGNIARAVAANNLRSGNTTSCGCRQREISAESAAKKFTTHGACRRNSPEWPEHRSWREMRRRCGDSKHISYAYYGGRGITVCDRWQTSFESFLADMGRMPGTGYSLGRIDVNGNYEPGNCKWETFREQIRNRRPFTEWQKWNSSHPLYGPNYRGN